MDHSFTSAIFLWLHSALPLGLSPAQGEPSPDIWHQGWHTLAHWFHLLFHAWGQWMEPLGQFTQTVFQTLGRWLQQAGAGLGNQWQQFVQASEQQLQAWGKTVTTVAGGTQWWTLGLYWLLLVMMLAGVVGSFVPMLPGVVLVLLAVVIWGIATGFGGVVWSLLVAIAAFILSVVVDNLAGLIGAQRAGASRWGQVGALVGMVVGFLVLTTAIPIFGPILGIILGTMLGAIVGEFLHRRDLGFRPRTQQSLKVGVAILVGSLVGNVLQGFLALVAMTVFIINTWSTVYG